MLRKGFFIMAHQCYDTSFYSSYKKLVKHQWKPYVELKQDQERQLRQMIGFAYKNVPYYHRLFKGLGFTPEDIRTVEDLEKLPILTKDIIKNNWNSFKPANLSSMKYCNPATGGSTGTPMQYRLSKQDRFLGGALLYRGWGYGGYELGDRMVFLAGSSLDVGTKSILATKVHEIVRNLKKLSSFDMGESEMRDYAQGLNTFCPRFIRGYPTSIYFFAKWLDENNISVPSSDAVFTTAEKLFPHMRKTISDVFCCDVFDTYGLNDGGISAYECPEHSGLHVDTERSIMEVVDPEGLQVDSGQGLILATSLNNYAMPFIRYDTGDLAHIIEDVCSCGRGSRLLKEVIGRSVDILQTPEGKNVHGWFLLYIFWEYGEGIKEYQVIQETLDKLVIKIVPEDDFNEKQLDLIRDVINSKSDKWNVEFRIVEDIGRTEAGKYKFIISKLET